MAELQARKWPIGKGFNEINDRVPDYCARRRQLRDLRQFAQSMTHARGAQEDRGGHGMNI